MPNIVFLIEDALGSTRESAEPNPPRHCFSIDESVGARHSEIWRGCNAGVRKKVSTPLQWKLEAAPEENARILDYRDAGIFNLRCRRLSNFAACSRLACVFRSAGSQANPR